MVEVSGIKSQEIIIGRGPKYEAYYLVGCADKSTEHEHIKVHTCVNYGTGDKMITYDICTFAKIKDFKNKKEAEKYSAKNRVQIVILSD